MVTVDYSGRAAPASVLDTVALRRSQLCAAALARAAGDYDREQLDQAVAAYAAAVDEARRAATEARAVLS